jgi:hypothetical protein
MSTSPCARATGPAIAYSSATSSTRISVGDWTRRLQRWVLTAFANIKEVVGRNTIGFNASGAISNQKRACTSRQVAGGECVSSRLTDQGSVCYNRVAGHGQMLRVAGAHREPDRQQLPYGFLSIKPRNLVRWGENGGHKRRG